MLETLQNNIQALIAAHESQRARAEKLSAELDRTSQVLAKAQGKIKELEDKVDSLSLRSAFTSSTGENKEAKARIDALVQEIDAALEKLQ